MTDEPEIVVKPGDWVVNGGRDQSQVDVHFTLEGLPKEDWVMGEIYNLVLPATGFPGEFRFRAQYRGNVYASATHTTEYHFLRDAVLMAKDMRWSGQLVEGPWESKPEESVTFSVSMGYPK